MSSIAQSDFAMSESRINEVTEMFTPLRSNITFTAGTRIFEENDKANDAYLIQKGYVEISRVTANEKKIEYLLGPGEIFGEIALLDGKTRTATAVAIHDTTVAPLTKQQIQSAIEGEDPLTQLLLHTAIRRLRKTLSKDDVDPNLTHLQTVGYGEYFQNTQKKAINYINRISSIQSAVSEQKFHLHYQPIIDLSTGFIKGFEALIRGPIDNPDLQRPDLFIPLAEDLGLIIPLGQWVLETAINGLIQLDAESAKLKLKNKVFMSVNVSAKQLEQVDVVENLAHTIEQSGFSEKRIKLEITETALLKQPDKAQSALNRLRQAGASIAIDDFGTGYSSLNYLHQFPLNTMKIDRSFISNIQTDQNRGRIVSAIINLAHDLGMDVVAEGIERKRELEWLERQNCEYAQGYYLDKPKTLVECIEMLKKAYY